MLHGTLEDAYRVYKAKERDSVNGTGGWLGHSTLLFVDVARKRKKVNAYVEIFQRGIHYTLPL